MMKYGHMYHRRCIIRALNLRCLAASHPASHQSYGIGNLPTTLVVLCLRGRLLQRQILPQHHLVTAAQQRMEVQVRMRLIEV